MRSDSRRFSTAPSHCFTCDCAALNLANVAATSVLTYHAEWQLLLLI
jgi:hypothetical protein